MTTKIQGSSSIQGSVLHRLKIARGHLNKVIKMVENGDYCVDVIHQCMAVQAALRETDQVVLRNHMETCVADAIRKGQSRQVIEEVMKVMEKK